MPFVISSGTKQYIVEIGQKLIVDRLNNDIDEVITIPVLTTFGQTTPTPTLKAKVDAHQKGIKIRVVKFRAKSTYHRQYGPRQSQTVITILGDSESNNIPKAKVEKLTPSDSNEINSNLPESKTTSEPKKVDSKGTKAVPKKTTKKKTEPQETQE